MARSKKPTSATKPKPIDPHKSIRVFSQKIFEGVLSFSSENLHPAEDFYVGWLDLMGAGHIMGTSVHKSANFLVRLHMAVEHAKMQAGFDLKTLPINDGIFIISREKGPLITVVRHAMILLAARFIATPRQHDRCLMKGGIAFGPIHSGEKLRPGIFRKKLRERPDYLERLMFGPPIIQAYRSEASAPPYGIAIHESARAFAPPGDRPFQMNFMQWWQTFPEAQDIPGLPPMQAFKSLLSIELDGYFEWMKKTLLYHGVPGEKVNSWATTSKQYFASS
jgi:hypothetical protein